MKDKRKELSYGIKINRVIGCGMLYKVHLVCT